MMADERRLNMTREDALDPAMPICDAHHHMWDYPHSRYLFDEYLRDISGGHHIVQTVFVECLSMYRKNGAEEMRPVGETESVARLAIRNESGPPGTPKVASGIVAYAELALGNDVVPVLEAHIEAGQGRLRGIRNTTCWDATPDIKTAHLSREGLLLEAKFREGFACLSRYDLSFDACLYHTQLEELEDLARGFPDVPIILNHVGMPLGIGRYAGRNEESFREWKPRIAALATCPNVFAKLGGFGMPLMGFDWHKKEVPPGSVQLAAAIAPYVGFCIEQYGVGRCMFESNFPVDKKSYSYSVLWNAFKRVTRDFSPGEKAALFHDTTVRVYRLAAND